MFRMNSKKLMRAFAIIMIVTLIPLAIASAAQRGDNRNTGSSWVNTDGSTTLFPIIEIAANQFPAAFPGENVGYDNGNGNGSGHGRTALISQVPIASGNGGPNEPIDVGLSSSPCSTGVTKDEHGVTNANFTEGGLTSNNAAGALTCAQLADAQIAKDGITILVSQTKVACIGSVSITSNMIAAIWGGMTYNGEGTTSVPTPPTEPVGARVQHQWQEFFPGCGTDNIVPVSRISSPTSSGTRSAFLDFNPQITTTDEGLEVTASGVARQTANADVENLIKNNPSYMGYTGMIFDNSLTAQIPVALSPGYSALGGSLVGPKPGVMPTYGNVANSSYPFSRPLHYYYKAGTSKQATVDLANFLLSAAGQGNIKKQGFVAAFDASPALTQPSGVTMSAPAPDWDVNADHSANVLDVTGIGSFFGQTAPASGDPSYPNVRGWVRGDVNFDAQVNVLDITTFGPNFGHTW